MLNLRPWPRGGTVTDDRYWGGYTRAGLVLHWVCPSDGLGPARSACGLDLTGSAWKFPEDQLARTATCARCSRIEDSWGRDPLPEPLAERRHRD